jgi:NAD(P)H dehydrogenase (quinone)
MNKLIVTANPSSLWFTHVIADKLETLSTQKWWTVEILDLYKTDLKQGFLQYENKKDMWKDSITQALQDKILRADEIVFIFPIRWWDVPAILKNFLDSNFIAGFAFKYHEWKQKWLLGGKSARVIATCWGPSILYTLLLHVQFWWNLNRISYWGMKQKSFTVFGNMDRSKTDRKKYLSKLERLV